MYHGGIGGSSLPAAPQEGQEAAVMAGSPQNLRAGRPDSLPELSDEAVRAEAERLLQSLLPGVRLSVEGNPDAPITGSELAAAWQEIHDEPTDG